MDGELNCKVLEVIYPLIGAMKLEMINFLRNFLRLGMLNIGLRFRWAWGLEINVSVLRLKDLELLSEPQIWML